MVQLGLANWLTFEVLPFFVENGLLKKCGILISFFKSFVCSPKRRGRLKMSDKKAKKNKTI